MPCCASSSFLPTWPGMGLHRIPDLGKHDNEMAGLVTGFESMLLFTLLECFSQPYTFVHLMSVMDRMQYGCETAR